jgi:hypothetical protein
MLWISSEVVVGNLHTVPHQMLRPARNGDENRQGSLQVSRFGAKQLSIRDSGAGQIKEVHVTNFMCHSNMRVEFHPHVNFISGPNGSGKSAILQALQYCLGVRATSTGRARSNAEYLKKGTDVCTASVRHPDPRPRWILNLWVYRSERRC